MIVPIQTRTQFCLQPGQAGRRTTQGTKHKCGVFRRINTTTEGEGIARHECKTKQYAELAQLFYCHFYSPKL